MGMRILLLLPSLVAGAVMAVWGGYWQGLIFVGASLIVQLGMLMVNRPPTVTEGSTIQIVGKTAFLDGHRMPNRLARWPPQARRLLFQHVQDASSYPNRESLASRLTSHCGELPVLGVELADEQQVLELDWNARPHALVVGPTGTGKSALLGALLISIDRHVRDPIEAIWYFDPKAGHSIAAHGGTFEILKSRRPSVRIELIQATDGPQLALALGALAESLVHRQGPSVVRIIVIVEELSLVLSDRAAAQHIQAIAAAGRTAGVRIIATNQTASGLPRGLLVNLTNRIVMQGSDQAEWLLLGNSDRPFRHSNQTSGYSREIAWRDDTLRCDEPEVFSAKLLNENRNFSFLADWSS